MIHRWSLILATLVLLAAVACEAPLTPQPLPSESEVNAARSTIERLKSNFHASKDDFTNTATLKHKNYSENKKTDLNSYILLSNSGYLNIFSSYLTSKIMMHKSFAVLVDGSVITSLDEQKAVSRAVEINTYMARYGVKPIDIDYQAILVTNQEFVNLGSSGTGIYETCQPHYKTIDASNILRFIASRPEAGIRVRLKGPDSLGGKTHDFTLDKRTHEAICQTVEYYDAIMVLWRAEGKRPPDLWDYRLSLYQFVQSKQL